MTEKNIALKMISDSWNASIQKFNSIIEALSDDDLKREVAPNRNTGIYLLGHMVAMHGRMFQLLGFGELLYPELYETFVDKRDKTVNNLPSAADLRLYWYKVNTALSEHFNKLSANEWFTKHSSVSEEDFQKEPHRNKLDVVLTRVRHLEYHAGQLVFLKN